MTLHLLHTSNSYTLMVNDRLVSGVKTDPVANKNLLYQARDAIVVIGYAGIAFGLHSSDRNMSTDEWIAETLWGKPIPRGLDEAPATLIFDEIGHVLTIGQSIKLLRAEMEKSFNKLPISLQKRTTLHVAVAGWKQTTEGIHFVVAHIMKDKGAFIIKSPPRYIYRMQKRACLVSFPDGYVSEGDLSKLAQHMGQLNQDGVEKLFVEEIRRVSSQYSDKVGPHCLSILLPPPNIGAAMRVRFIPTTEHKATLKSPSRNFGSRTLAVAFSPWIIGPRMLCAPALVVGSDSVQMGPIRINREAPDTPGIAALFSQRRSHGN